MDNLVLLVAAVLEPSDDDTNVNIPIHMHVHVTEWSPFQGRLTFDRRR
jgi:hypothetical protein